jgi:hypothetical protein
VPDEALAPSPLYESAESIMVLALVGLMSTNRLASGSTAECYKLNLGHTPESLQGSSSAAPLGNAVCEAGARWQEVPGAQDKKGNGTLTSASKLARCDTERQRRSVIQPGVAWRPA